MLKKDLETKVSELENRNSELLIEIEELRREVADRRGDPRPWLREVKLAMALESLMPTRLRRKLRKDLGEDFLADLPKSWNFLRSA